MSFGIRSQTVNVSRRDLLEALELNLEKHKKAYAQAVINYRKALQVDLTAALIQANDPNSQISKIKVEFNHPVSYANQYQKAIDMLKLSVDETINIDSDSFFAYFKDEWSWKSGFDLANSIYARKAASAHIGGSL